MRKLAAAQCFHSKPDPSGRDCVLGDGLFLRVRASGTQTFLIEYPFERARRKLTIGVLDRQGAPGQSRSASLEHGRLPVAQARAIAGQWNADRRAGRIRSPNGTCAALELIAEGQHEGRTAKHLAGEVRVQAKRLWRVGAAREWIDACISRRSRSRFALDRGGQGLRVGADLLD